MYRHHVNCFLIFIVFLLLCTVQVQANGQDITTPDEKNSSENQSDWKLSFTPYALFAAQSSDVGTTNLRQSFNDLASITNMGFQGRMLIQWREYYMSTDWTYAKMSSNTTILRTTIDMDLEQDILDLKLGKVVYDSTSPKMDGGIRVVTGVGARYWKNRVDLIQTTQPILPGEPERVETLETGQSWWDPEIELGLQFPVTPGVGFVVMATGGGFGIGKASDYMWDAAFTAVFKPFRRIAIPVGYRLFKYDRHDGLGDDEIRQTVTVSGPVIGIRIEIF